MDCSLCKERSATHLDRQSHARLCPECAAIIRQRRGFDTGFDRHRSVEPLLHPLLHRNRGRAHAGHFLSPEACWYLVSAAYRAAEHGSPDVKPEHLLLSLLDDPQLADVFTTLVGADPTSLKERLNGLLDVKAPLPQPDTLRLSPRLLSVLQITHDWAAGQGHTHAGPSLLIRSLLGEGEGLAARVLAEAASVGGHRPEAFLPQKAMEPASQGQRTESRSAISQFTRDLTELARRGLIEPVIGRASEVEQVVHILAGRMQRNVVLLGERGVGKAAIADALAQRIARGQVPKGLQNHRLLTLDLEGLALDGHMMERFSTLIVEIGAQALPVVLFIDHLDVLFRDGPVDGGNDFLLVLERALATGHMRCICSMTLDEYRRLVQPTHELERRFRAVMVRELSAEQTLEILRRLKEVYETHYAVYVSDLAMVAACDLSDQYIGDRLLPDKAIDLLDEACALKQFSSHHRPPNRSEPGNYPDEPEVTPGDIANVVSEWTGIPAHRLALDEQTRLLSMEAHLKRQVIGQEEAIDAITEAIRRCRSRIEPNRPIASFIFLGASGMGQLELARALAEFLFNDDHALTRFNLRTHRGDRLMGDLAEAIRQRPSCVLLLQEIEKADTNVLNSLRTMIERGRLPDGEGQVVDCRDLVVVMTSHVKADHILKLQHEGQDWDTIKTIAMEALAARLDPEFVQRVDAVVVFHLLDHAQLLRIIDFMLEPTRRRLHAQNLSITFTDAALEALAVRGFMPEFGARPLRRAIQTYIDLPIRRLLLEEACRPGVTIRVDATGGVFTFWCGQSGTTSELERKGTQEV